MPRLVVAADLHLDDLGSWKRRGVLGDAEHSLVQLVDYAVAHQAEALVLLGDIFNRPNPSPRMVRFLLDQIDHCERHNVRWVYILGQHDGRQDWLSTHPWPEHAHKALLQLGPWTATGLDWTPAGRLQEELAAMPEVDILLAHQVWGDFMGSVASIDGHLAEVARARWVFTGDYHVARDARVGDLRVISPGAAAMQAIDEPEEKSFVVVSPGEGGELLHAQESLHTRPVIRLQAYDAADEAVIAAHLDGWFDAAATLAEGLPEPVRLPLVDVIYRDDLPGFVSRLTAAVADRGVIFLRPRDRDEAAAAAAVPQLELSEYGLLEGLDDELTRGTCPYAIARRLLAGHLHLTTELAALRAEFLAGYPHAAGAP